MIVAAATLAAAAAAAVVAALLGDATVGAAIAGAFSVANTCLAAWLLRSQQRVRRGQEHIQRGQEHTHRILTAPRRAVYDSDGRMIGTVLRLEDESWATQLLPPRRADDPLPDPQTPSGGPTP